MAKLDVGGVFVEKTQAVLVYLLDLLKMLGERNKCSPKWLFHVDLPWYNEKNHLKQILYVHL